MSNIKSLATMAVAAALLPSALGVFDASSNSNMAVYWGQGPNQQRLAHFCEDPNIDIINVGFLNQFPDQTGGYPGTNFGNQCGDATYKNPDGSSSPLLSDCPLIGPDITTCQQAGKKVLLSLGGAIPSNQHINDDASANAFADFLWTSFGPQSASSSAPRPFGDAVVDGFDFDIESVLINGEATSDLSNGYSTVINRLRSYYLLETSKSFYISGAPQCIVPDAHLADAIETSYFDFIFVQFYNTAQCSARAYFDHSYGGTNTNISFSAWVDFVHNSGLNKNAKVFLGLPASTSVVVAPDYYLSQAEAKQILQAFQCEYPDAFGGVMVYEATASETNSENGTPYADVLKSDLIEGCGTKQSTSSSASSTKTSSASLIATSSSASSVKTTPASSTGSQALPPGLAPPSSAPYPIPSGSAPSSGPTGSSGALSPSGSGSPKTGTGPYPSRSIPAKSGTAPYSSGTPPVKSGTAPYPSGSASVKSGTAPGTAPYPSGSASVKSGTAPGTAPYQSKTGTAPYTVKTGTAPYTVKTDTAPSNSASATFIPSGASSGFLPSGSATLSVPYPVNNSSSTILSTGNSSPSTTGEETVSVTNIVTVTSCSPDVTNCPAKTHPVVSTEVYVSTFLPGSSASVPAGGPSASSAPENSPQSTQEIVTTEFVTSYVTTCPVTSTATSGSIQVIETGLTTSTVFSTVTSTICTKCVAPPTPAPTQKATTGSPYSQNQSPATAGASQSAPVEVVTTVIEYTTLTTCPVTNTVTSGTSEIVQVTQSVSVITSSVTSVVTITGTPGSSPPLGPSNTAIAGIPGSGHQGPAMAVPVGSSQGSSSPAGFSPSESKVSSPEGKSQGSSPAGSNSPSEVESGTQGSKAPSTPAKAGSSGSSSAPQAAGSPAASQGAPGSSESRSGAQAPAGNSPAAPAGQSPTPTPASSSPSGPKTIQSTINFVPVETLTVVPVPVSPSQTAVPNSPIESGEQASGVPSNGAPANSAASGSGSSAGSTAPFPASNGTAPASATGSSSPSSPAQPSQLAFQGAASRMDVGVFGLVAFVVAALSLF